MPSFSKQSEFFLILSKNKKLYWKSQVIFLNRVTRHLLVGDKV